MAVTIHNFSIVDDGQGLAIDVETNVGYNISHINLWTMNDFKDYSLAKSLDFKLEQVNNKEVFIVTAEELNFSPFEDIYFMEIESTYLDEDDDCSTCNTPALGITYGLLKYYQCLLNYFLESDISDCLSCNNTFNNDTVITINLLLEMVENAIEIGYYTQAVDMITKLKKLCSLKNCNNCPTIVCSSCSKFKQY